MLAAALTGQSAAAASLAALRIASSVEVRFDWMFGPEWALATVATCSSVHHAVNPSSSNDRSCDPRLPAMGRLPVLTAGDRGATLRRTPVFRPAPTATVIEEVGQQRFRSPQGTAPRVGAPNTARTSLLWVDGQVGLAIWRALVSRLLPPAAGSMMATARANSSACACMCKLPVDGPVHSFRWDIPLPKLADMIKLTGNNHIAIEVGDPAQANPNRSKALTLPLAAVVQPVVVVTVKRRRRAHGAREIVNDLEPVRMTCASLVRDEHVSAQRAQLVDVSRENGGPVAALGSIAPPIPWCRCLGQFVTRSKLWSTRQPRVPNGLAEDAAEASNLDPIWKRDDAPVKIPVKQGAIEDVFEVAGRVGVVVAVDEPHSVGNLRQLFMQRSQRLQITQQDDGRGIEINGAVDDVREVAVGVTAHQNRTACANNRSTGGAS